MAPIDLHSVWAAGNLTMLLGSLYTILKVFTFRGIPTFIYKTSFAGVLLSYAVVIQNSLGTPRLDASWFRRAIIDENIQYAILAVFWFVSKPIWYSIFPFAVFSLFHTLTFARTNIIPKFVPPVKPVQQGQQRPPPAALENVSRQIAQFTKNQYAPMMKIVAFSEILLLGRTLLGALTFTSSYTSPLFLAHFIRLRYSTSRFTREAIDEITRRIDTAVGNQNGMAKNGWETVKRGIRAWAGTLLPLDQVHGGAPAAATGQRAGATAAAATGRAGAGTARAR